MVGLRCESRVAGHLLYRRTPKERKRGEIRKEKKEKKKKEKK